LLQKLRDFSIFLRTRLEHLDYQTLQGEHPIVPVFIRDTEKTTALVNYLFERNILVTGLNYPVVPKGEQEIRLQVNADHTEQDLNCLLEALAEFNK
jgi:glycine C-acetyltransferase